MSVLKSILHHYNKTTKSYDVLHPETDSAQVTDWHQAVKNSVISEDIKSEILKFQATLSQETVPSGNTEALTTLLSGIVHQIAALSGKSNWWEAPKDSFETLSAGVVAGDVSNPNSWWVKLGGTIPLIIQGVSGYIYHVKDTTYTLPISYSSFFIPVTGFGQAQQAWYPDAAALTVRKLGLTSIGLSCHSDCSVYVITIGT